MRTPYILIVLIFAVLPAYAQITLEERPLESNPVLQNYQRQAELAHERKLKRLFGTTPAATSRNSGTDCEDDGIFEDGDRVYVISGDSVRVCIDTIGFATMTNLSIEGNFGTTSVDTNCIVYHAFAGIELGLGDTIIVELCLANGGCVYRTFPVVVKRENNSFLEAPISLETEEEAILCADPSHIDLPEGIFLSGSLDCHDPLLARVSNGNTKDSCFLLTAKRFAGIDTICFKIGNAYCIIDTFRFPFVIIGDTLDLPFVDDFSYPGPYPGREWLDIHTFVNNHYSRESPSVGFATFDGLDAGGSPYGGPGGRSDFLTSNYIDLSSYDANSNVYLSFYAEPKGLGYRPDTDQGDSLVLEFKNDMGNWEYIDGFVSPLNIPIDSVPPWLYYQYHIAEDKYFYRGFQFRFVNYADAPGILDIWHVDYVRLTSDIIPDTTFPDIAFTQPPKSILRKYSNMPFRHFTVNEANELTENVDIELFSQFSDTTLAEPSDLTIREKINNIVVHYDAILLEDPLTQRNVPPFVHKHHVNPIDFDPFPAFPGDSLIFETQYTFVIANQNPGLYPQTARNDTVRHTTYMTNFFSYDDGSAETAMSLGNGQNWAFGLEFTANIDDTLRAIQIHFPHYRDSETTQGAFNIRVYTGSLNSAPVYEKQFVDPFFADTWLDTLQGYTTYRLTDAFEDPSPVFIPAGKFYIVLEQAASINHPVWIGLDKNTPQAKNFQYVWNTANWFPLQNNGAAMVRAVVGDHTPISTPAKEIVRIEESIKIYPNPSSGLFNFEIQNGNYEDYRVSVFNTIGQLMLQLKPNSSTLDLSNLPEGIYLLRFDNLKTKSSIDRKVVVSY